jgi:hypothetical protein
MTGQIPIRTEDRYAMQDPYARRTTSPYAKKAPSLSGRLWRVLGVSLIFVVVAALGSLGVFGIYSIVRPPAIEAYAQDGISISGITDEDFLITPEELIAYDCTRTAIEGTGSGQAGESKAGRIRAYGPYLEDFLASYGCSIEDFRRIRVLCKDDYTVILRPERFEGEVDVILSVAEDKDALLPYQRPLRLVIPSESTGQWAIGVVRIEFIR